MGVTWATPPNRPPTRRNYGAEAMLLNPGHFVVLGMDAMSRNAPILGVYARPETPQRFCGAKACHKPDKDMRGGYDGSDLEPVSNIYLLLVKRDAISTSSSSIGQAFSR
jgi:hypothetical protein